MGPGKEKPAGHTLVWPRVLTKHEHISARQNRVCPCPSMLYSLLQPRAHPDKDRSGAADAAPLRLNFISPTWGLFVLSAQTGAVQLGTKFSNFRQNVITLLCLSVFSHSMTCAQVGNKCGLTSALIEQKSESEPSSNLCGDVSIFIPNWGTILPAYYRRYKVASSVNLYRFTRLRRFPQRGIFVNCLFGKHPQSPLNATWGDGYAFILNAFTY